MIFRVEAKRAALNENVHAEKRLCVVEFELNFFDRLARDLRVVRVFALISKHHVGSDSVVAADFGKRINIVGHACEKVTPDLCDVFGNGFIADNRTVYGQSFNEHGDTAGKARIAPPVVNSRENCVVAI